MMTATDLFPDWHRIADPGASGETVTARRKVAAGLAKKRSIADRLNLARIFLSLAPVGDDFEAGLIQSFRDGDPTMPATGNAALLRVLAGSVLAMAFEKGDVGTDAAALALVSASYGGQGVTGEPIPELIPRAAYLAKRSRELRDLSSTPAAASKSVSRGPNSKVSLTESITVPTFASIPNHQHFANASANFDAIKPVLSGLLSAVAALEKQLDHVVATAKTAIADAKRAGDPRVETLQEETNLLWWVLTAHSEMADAPLDELAPAARALYAARELSNQTQKIPGHLGATGFLHRALGEADNDIEMHNAVVSVSRDVRLGWTQGIEVNQAKGILPLTHAMLASLQVADGADWRPIADAAPGPDSSTTLGALSLAEQFYTETLLARLLMEAS